VVRGREARNEYQRRYRRAHGVKERVVRPRRACPVCGESVRLQNRRFCSWICWERDRYELWIARWISGEFSPHHQDRGHVHPNIKRWWIEQHGEQCRACGWAIRHPTTGKVPLEWNHIDGDCSNNCFGNLELLCPNCHALTENHGSLNYGKSKRRRKWAGSGVILKPDA
jgi:RNA polymerase subunit RPABC4/transcription elongation factor Spt4